MPSALGLVLIETGSWRQDVNKMLGPVELIPSKSASNVSLMIMLLKIFGRLQMTSESIIENVIGLCQYHKYQC